MSEKNNNQNNFSRYEKMSLEDLVKNLRKELKNSDITAIQKIVEEIRYQFDKKFGALLKEKKDAFLEDGGESIDFYYTNPIKKEFDKLVRTYKDRYQKHYKAVEKNQKENLNKKQAIVEGLKEIIAEGIVQDSYKKFQSLKKMWETTGKVPREHYNCLLQNYRHQVHKFYKLSRINEELRELDFKRNLEKKLKLVERAKELDTLTDPHKAYQRLQNLYALWKEIGPVPEEKNETIWEAFKAAAQIIKDKHKVFLGERDDEEQKNTERKKQIIKALAEIDYASNTSKKEWNESIKTFEQTREEYFKIGFASKKEREILWKELGEITKKFNRAKNSFFKSIKKDEHKNLVQKKELIEEVKNIDKNLDFSTLVTQIKQYEKKWKTIGHVPYKEFRSVEKAFRQACDSHFERRRQTKEEGTEQQQENLKKKEALLSTAREKMQANDLDLATVKTLLHGWYDIGFVPKKNMDVRRDFEKLMHKAFKKLSIKTEEREFIEFKIGMDVFASNGAERKIQEEAAYISQKIETLDGKITQAENNFSFFNAKDSKSPIIKGIKSDIADLKRNRNNYQQRMEYLRNLKIEQ